MIDIEKELESFLDRVKTYDESNALDAYCLKWVKSNFIDTIEEYLIQEFAHSDIMEEEKREAFQEGYNEGYDYGCYDTERAMRDSLET